jgi:hypothetical protein
MLISVHKNFMFVLYMMICYHLIIIYYLTFNSIGTINNVTNINIGYRITIELIIKTTIELKQDDTNDRNASETGRETPRYK